MVMMFHKSEKPAAAVQAAAGLFISAFYIIYLYGGICLLEEKRSVALLTGINDGDNNAVVYSSYDRVK